MLCLVLQRYRRRDYTEKIEITVLLITLGF